MKHLVPTSSLALVLLLSGCGGTQDADPGQPVEVEEPAPDPAPEQSTAETSEEEEEEGPGEGDLVLSDDACETDEDCIPGACCHATTCVGEGQAPSCDDAMCTQECRYGTIDCGGGCLCHEGRCAARLSVAPRMLPRE